MSLSITDYTVRTDSENWDLDATIRLTQSTIWAQNRPYEIAKKAISNSLCVGVFLGDRQVALSRVVTDYATYAYLCDVIVEPEHRGRGVAKLMMRGVLDHPELQTIRRWSLLTVDAHGLYKQFGFANLEVPDRYMQIFDPCDKETGFAQ